jgi:hypothetical protein
MLKVEIHFKRQIGEQWSKWFDGSTLSHLDDETFLSGLVKVI